MTPAPGTTLIALIYLNTLVTNAWMLAGNGERLKSFRLRSTSGDDLNFQRSQLESLFSEKSSLYDDDMTLHVGGLFESLSPLPVHDWTDPNFDDSEWMDLASPCRDDECEQCEIPDDYKNHPVQIDVLDFLGIQRAKPLNTRKRL
mmetsp:Transcript_21750/g.31757  ORF Transcript_21750/g.31757 Transcript_21750/m.31757 type:complete len:145 (+) Transcript_21750:55-489(+)|eukprot:CAMPEP_0197246742 /NCGR_PEP_ID=MMETSP1429-20130617/21018_1 /TAXON_ID=49237 /ORGANISM="Chaetoceros  sp., Strain UNC1202" /LENGTH=144 /DNA_ID=CAMNT_0042707477 /DNA_START=39 /DNA_END=473 /DNA_ORIENTATION=+